MQTAAVNDAIRRVAMRIKNPLKQVVPEQELLPWQIPAWHDKSRIMLLTGSAGGGKSYLAAKKVHQACKDYPGSMWLLVRKTRESMNNSTVLFMKNTIINRDPSVTFKPSTHRFEYDNGSIIAYGGMANEEQREQVRSIGQAGGLDGIWVEEANKLSESDFNELLARLRGSVSPYRQIVLTTNPDAPLHWINERLIMRKEASVYYSGAKDNPHNPAEYLQTLEMLTGIQHQRLVLGKWVQAEGAVYDNWTEDNVSESADYDPNRAVIWGVDDGYAQGEGIGSASYHPRVFLLMQVTAQGGVNIFAEYVATGEMPEKSIKSVLGIVPEGATKAPFPEAAYVDSSAAELLARIRNEGILSVGSTHIVTEGIKNVRRLIGDGNGVRLLKVHPRCKRLIAEMVSYVYDDNLKAINGELKPSKMNDHCLDALRYGVWHLRYGA